MHDLTAKAPRWQAPRYQKTLQSCEIITCRASLEDGIIDIGELLWCLCSGLFWPPCMRPNRDKPCGLPLCGDPLGAISAKLECPATFNAPAYSLYITRLQAKHHGLIHTLTIGWLAGTISGTSTVKLGIRSCMFCYQQNSAIRTKSI